MWQLWRARTNQSLKAALPIALTGMNGKLMRAYVEYVADFLLTELGMEVMYGTANPVRRSPVGARAALMFIQFPFMETTAVGGRANFFERGVSDYIGAVV